MQTENIVKYAVIAVGGYLVYRYVVEAGMIPDYLGLVGGAAGASTGNGQGQNQIPGGTSNGQTVGGPGNGNGPMGAPQGQYDDLQAGPRGDKTDGQGQSQQAASVRQKVLEAAGPGSKQFWAWNYYHPNKTAIDPFQLPESAWAATSLGRRPVNVEEVEGTPLTFDQYWSLISAGGFAGLVPARGTNVWNAQALRWVQ